MTSSLLYRFYERDSEPERYELVEAKLQKRNWGAVVLPFDDYFSFGWSEIDEFPIDDAAFCTSPKSRAAFWQGLRRILKRSRRRQDHAWWQQLYNEFYRQTDYWQELRRRVLWARSAKCEACGEDTKPLHVHHSCYCFLGEESPHDVTLLCEPHHLLIWHERNRRPICR
jgi:hypothetical protein